MEHIVLGGLLTRLGESGVFVQGYTDDLVILFTGRFEHSLRVAKQNAQNCKRWCNTAGLTINLAKVCGKGWLAEIGD